MIGKVKQPLLELILKAKGRLFTVRVWINVLAFEPSLASALLRSLRGILEDIEDDLYPGDCNFEHIALKIATAGWANAITAVEVKSNISECGVVYYPDWP